MKQIFSFSCNELIFVLRILYIIMYQHCPIFKIIIFCHFKKYQWLRFYPKTMNLRVKRPCKNPNGSVVRQILTEKPYQTEALKGEGEFLKQVIFLNQATGNIIGRSVRKMPDILIHFDNILIQPSETPHPRNLETIAYSLSGTLSPPPLYLNFLTYLD